MSKVGPTYQLLKTDPCFDMYPTNKQTRMYFPVIQAALG